MLEYPQDQTTKEICSELKLLTKAIIVKLSNMFGSDDVFLCSEEIAKISSKNSSINFSLLIPKSVESNIKKLDAHVCNSAKYARSVLNSTLSGIKRELNDIVNYGFIESNLKYTGFSISPFGFTIEIPKDRLVAVKIRKITTEIVASLNFDELKQEVLCDSRVPSQLPRDIVFAALKKRRDIANSLPIPHNEYDIDEINFRMEELRSAIKNSNKNPALIAS